MKRLIAIFLLISLVFSLTACDLQNLFGKESLSGTPATEQITTVPTDEDAAGNAEPDVPDTTVDTEAVITEDITEANTTEGTTEPEETEPKETEKPTEPKETEKPTEPPQTEPPAPVLPDYYPGDFAQQIHRLLNEERSNAGVGALSLNNTLSRISYVRATEISSTWSHTRPDGSSWSTVFDQYGVSWGGGIAENLAYISYSDAADVVYSWMNSSGHKANILNGSYSEIGVGVYYSGGNYYICTLFRA